MKALSHAAGIISSLLPGCAEPPSPPKSARVYRPAFRETAHGPPDGVTRPSPGDNCCDMQSPSPPMHFGNPYPENSATYSNYGAGVRAANAMQAAHTAYEIVSPGLGGPQVGYAPSQAIQGIGMAMHSPAAFHVQPAATPRGGSSMHGFMLHEPQMQQGLHRDVVPLQPQSGPPSVPIPSFQAFSGW